MNTEGEKQGPELWIVVVLYVCSNVHLIFSRWEFSCPLFVLKALADR